MTFSLEKKLCWQKGGSYILFHTLTFFSDQKGGEGGKYDTGRCALLYGTTTVVMPPSRLGCAGRYEGRVARRLETLVT